MELSNTPGQSESDTQTVQNQPVVQKVQSVKKRRLATTRGLNSSGRGAAQYSVTPNNTPSRISVIHSTPITTQSIPAFIPTFPLQGISSIPGPVRLPPHPPFSPAGQLGRPVTGPAVLPPRSSTRVSLISPSLYVTGAECGALSAEPEPDPSLDWDNFGESPTFGILQAARGIQALQLTECLKEVEDITGIEDIRKLTLVETSESSLHCEQHSDNMEPSQQRELMLDENDKLEKLRDAVYDMMSD